MYIVSEFLDTFVGSQFNVDLTHLILHSIDTQAVPPLKVRFRPPTHEWRGFFDQKLDRLLSLEHRSETDPGVCLYESRSVVVRKEDGSVRLCVYYRCLNAQKVKDAYTLPQIDKILSC